MDLKTINSLTLAYLGDSVYELYIRQYLINKGIAKVNNLQHEAIKYVSARGQDKAIKKLLNSNFLTEEEMDIFARGRNAKSYSHPKNTDIITYKYATGFEALIGYLYLSDKNRLDKVMEFCVED